MGVEMGIVIAVVVAFIVSTCLFKAIDKRAKSSVPYHHTGQVHWPDELINDEEGVGEDGGDGWHDDCKGG